MGVNVRPYCLGVFLRGAESAVSVLLASFCRSKSWRSSLACGEGRSPLLWEAQFLKPRYQLPGTVSLSLANLGKLPLLSSFAAGIWVRKTLFVKSRLHCGKFGPALAPHTPHKSPFQNHSHLSELIGSKPVYFPPSRRAIYSYLPKQTDDFCSIEPWAGRGAPKGVCTHSQPPPLFPHLWSGGQ